MNKTLAGRYEDIEKHHELFLEAAKNKDFWKANCLADEFNENAPYLYSLLTIVMADNAKMRDALKFYKTFDSYKIGIDVGAKAYRILTETGPNREIEI